MNDNEEDSAVEMDSPIIMTPFQFNPTEKLEDEYGSSFHGPAGVML